MKNRIPQVQELIKHELGQIILRELEMPDGAVVTVTRVVASGNLQQAKVYISVMPEEKSVEVMRSLQQNIYSIQQLLNARLKMRPVPRIQWLAETATAEAQKIDEILEQIRREE